MPCIGIIVSTFFSVTKKRKKNKRRWLHSNITGRPFVATFIFELNSKGSSTLYIKRTLACAWR
jgi:hypothetical protein